MRLPAGELPDLTLGYQVAAWIEDHCVIPDRDQTGEPFRLSREQLRFVLWFYALREDGRFAFRRGQLVRPQKWGKGPLSAAIICAEASGPVVFDGFDAAGEPVGRPWATPWIQVVAVSEDQTDNVWTSLVPMIELGSLAADIPDTGKTRINVRGAGGSAGLIEPVTSAHLSRLGQRLTFAVHDETHAWFSHNGGVKLADTQRRNLAGMGGRALETTNAWDPAEQSVAQTTFEANLPDVLIDYPDPKPYSIRNKRERRSALRHAYAGAPWVDIDRIDAEIEELLLRDPNQARRFFFNEIVAGMDKAFDVKAFAARGTGEPIKRGRMVTLGFDGALFHDSVGIVATEVATGHQQVVGHWFPDPDLPPDEEWEAPVHEIHEAMDDAFSTWDVFRLYGDPAYFMTEMDQWAGKFGEKRVVKWWTNRKKAMAFAIRAWHQDWTAERLTHAGEPNDLTDPLVEHVGNSVKWPTRIRDDDTGQFLWVIGKDGQKSPRKMDLAMAAILSWKARGDAIELGALNRKKYRTAAW